MCWGLLFLQRRNYKDSTEFPDAPHSVSPMLRAYVIWGHSSQPRNQLWYMTINQRARFIHIPLVFPSCPLGSRNASRILCYHSVPGVSLASSGLWQFSRLSLPPMTLTALKSTNQGFWRVPTPPLPGRPNYRLMFFPWSGMGYGLGGQSGGNQRGELSGSWHPIKGACWQPLIMEVSFEHLAKVRGARFSHYEPPLLLPSMLTRWNQVIQCSHSGWGVKLQILEGMIISLNCLEFFPMGD